MEKIDWPRLIQLYEASDPEEIRRLQEELGILGRPNEFAEHLGDDNYEVLIAHGWTPWWTPDEFSKKPAPPWLVPLYIPSGMTTWYGTYGCGKTFIALDAALSIATGSHFLGQPCAQQNVVYFLAEGQGGFTQRIESWCLARGMKMDDLSGRFWVVPAKMKTDEPSVIEALLKDFKVGLAVLDTWGRTIVPGDENLNKDVNEKVEMLQGVATATGASFWYIHHIRKDDSSSPRGASALSGAVDCEVRVEAKPSVTDFKAVKLTCTKQKDAAHFKPVTLVMERHAYSLVPSAVPEDDPDAIDNKMQQQAALIFAAQQAPLSTKDATQLLQTSEPTARRRLQELVTTGTFELVGAGPQTRYQLKERSEP